MSGSLGAGREADNLAIKSCHQKRVADLESEDLLFTGMSLSHSALRFPHLRMGLILA